MSTYFYGNILQTLFSIGVGQAAVLVIYDVITFPVVTFTFLRAPINKVLSFYTIFFHWDKFTQSKSVFLMKILHVFGQVSNLSYLLRIPGFCPISHDSAMDDCRESHCCQFYLLQRFEKGERWDDT